MKLFLFLLISITVAQIMVIGKPGVGKSYLINALLSSEVAKESYTDDIGTQIPTLYKYENFIEIMDTPGLFDTDTDPVVALKHYTKDFKLSIIIVCYDMSERRLSNQDFQIIRILTELFGSDVSKRTIFVLTQANIVCEREKFDRYKNIIKSKVDSLRENGVKHIIAAGDKQDIICKSDFGNIHWMENFWSLTMEIFSSNIELIKEIYDKPIVIKNEISKQAYNEAYENIGGCISQYSKLGGIEVGKLKAGDYIWQNNKLIKVLFTWKHLNPMYVYKFGDVGLTSQHYIMQNGIYIKAKYAKYDNVALEPTMYIVTELEDLYFDSGIVASTYVWNYNMMKFLHIPFRFILNILI